MFKKFNIETNIVSFFMKTPEKYMIFLRNFKNRFSCSQPSNWQKFYFALQAKKIHSDYEILHL